VSAESQPRIGGSRFVWLDARTRATAARRAASEPFEIEWRGVDFLADERPDLIRAYRSEFWPQTGNVPNWDAIGRRETGAGHEWLLVEAKGHLRELDQACAAKVASLGGSREAIAGRLDEVKAAISPGSPNDWLAHYYQFANRVATLWFLAEQGVQARLLHVCFEGEGHFRDAPRTAEEWRCGRDGIAGLDAMHGWFGRPFEHSLEARLHELFLPVDAVGARAGGIRISRGAAVNDSTDGDAVQRGLFAGQVPNGFRGHGCV
jgi:hypothetical protein